MRGEVWHSLARQARWGTASRGVVWPGGPRHGLAGGARLCRV